MDTGDFCTTIVPTRLTTSKDALDYNMFHRNRGICLILENETFSPYCEATRHMSRRVGSEVDRDQIVTLFSKLGFDIVLHKDLTTRGVRVALKQVAMYDHGESDCFICFVLTHGDHGHLYAHDGRYAIDYLFAEFLGDKCPSLVGKPKIFFIQACQGNRLDPGVVVSADDLDVATYFKIPTYADFLICYSTLPGFYSFRNTEKGSWFIRALVQTMHDHHLEYDLLSIMTMVCRQVAYNYTSNATNPALTGLKQVPCITSMLTRRVFFHLKTLHM